MLASVNDERASGIGHRVIRQWETVRNRSIHHSHLLPFTLLSQKPEPRTLNF